MTTPDLDANGQEPWCRKLECDAAHLSHHVVSRCPVPPDATPAQAALFAERAGCIEACEEIEHAYREVARRLSLDNRAAADVAHHARELADVARRCVAAIRERARP